MSQHKTLLQVNSDFGAQSLLNLATRGIQFESAFHAIWGGGGFRNQGSLLGILIIRESYYLEVYLRGALFSQTPISCDIMTA